jgi:hypothetical protein
MAAAELMNRIYVMLDFTSQSIAMNATCSAGSSFLLPFSYPLQIQTDRTINNTLLSARNYDIYICIFLFLYLYLYLYLYGMIG